MKLYINSIADLELCARNPVNVEKKNEKMFTFDRIFRLFMIQFFFLIYCQASSSKLILLQFYCSFIGDRHETKCACQEITVWLSALKSPFKLFFRVNNNTTLLALQRSRLLRLDDDGKDKRFSVVGRRVGVSQQKSFFWNWNQQQMFSSV